MATTTGENPVQRIMLQNKEDQGGGNFLELMKSKVTGPYQGAIPDVGSTLTQQGAVGTSAQSIATQNVLSQFNKLIGGNQFTSAQAQMPSEAAPVQGGQPQAEKTGGEAAQIQATTYGITPQADVGSQGGGAITQTTRAIPQGPFDINKYVSPDTLSKHPELSNIADMETLRAFQSISQLPSEFSWRKDGDKDWSQYYGTKIMEYMNSLGFRDRAGTDAKTTLPTNIADMNKWNFMVSNIQEFANNPAGESYLKEFNYNTETGDTTGLDVGGQLKWAQAWTNPAFLDENGMFDKEKYDTAKAEYFNSYRSGGPRLASRTTYAKVLQEGTANYSAYQQQQQEAMRRAQSEQEAILAQGPMSA